MKCPTNSAPACTRAGPSRRGMPQSLILQWVSCYDMSKYPLCNPSPLNSAQLFHAAVSAFCAQTAGCRCRAAASLQGSESELSTVLNWVLTPQCDQLMKNLTFKKWAMYSRRPLRVFVDCIDIIIYYIYHIFIIFSDLFVCLCSDSSCLD